MKYLVIREQRNDAYVDEFETKEEAIAFADEEWRSMCEQDKNSTSNFYVLESINPDEDADNHFDGNPIKEWKR